LPDGPRLLGLGNVNEVERGWFEVEAGARGAWPCAGPAEYLRALSVQPVDGAVLRLAIVEPNQVVLSADRRPLPAISPSALSTPALTHVTPTDDAIVWPELAARSHHDLWLFYRGSGEVFHGNGVAWEARPAGVVVIDLWVDDTGAAWLVGEEGNVVLRWDPSGRGWRALAVPADLGATRIIGASASDVWLLGETAYHHWDGSELRRGPAVLGQLNDAWMSKNGELWVVGAEGGEGRAFRAPEVKR
jgi:hypothetical protein